jgi:hypothetical protein
MVDDGTSKAAGLWHKELLLVRNGDWKGLWGNYLLHLYHSSVSPADICVPCIVSTWHLFPTMYQAGKCDPACQVKLLFHQTQAFYCCGSAQDSFPIYFLRLLISSIMCQERHDWICFFEAITEGRGSPPKYITPSDLYYSSLVWIYLSLKFI